MIESIERLVGARGGDGTSMTGSLPSCGEASEVEMLMEAWFQERGRSNECLLLLSRVRRLLTRAVARGELGDRGAREARRLLRLIALVEENSAATDA